MLQHAGNNLPLETSMYLLFLLLFGIALCYALCKYGQKEGFQELITSAEGWAQVCYCFTFVAAPCETYGTNLAPWSFTEVGCYRTRIADS